MKNVLKKLKTFCLISAVGVGTAVMGAEGKTSKDLENTQAAIVMINHVNWVVNNVKNTNNST